MHCGRTTDGWSAQRSPTGNSSLYTPPTTERGTIYLNLARKRAQLSLLVGATLSRCRIYAKSGSGSGSSEDRGSICCGRLWHLDFWRTHHSAAGARSQIHPDTALQSKDSVRHRLAKGAVRPSYSAL